MYHDFAESSMGGYTLAWKTFCDQLDYLQHNGFLGAGFGALEASTSFEDSRLQPVLLSFDDGYGSFLRAADMLAQRGMRGTFFLTKDYCLRREGFLKDAEIRALAKIAEVGTHGVTHTPMSRLSREQLRQELVDSKHWLEDLSGREVRYMSAPGGYWDVGCQKLALEAGYHLVGNSKEWWNRPDEVVRSRQVNRVAVRTHFNSWQFARILARDGRFFVWRRLRTMALVPTRALRSHWELRSIPSTSAGLPVDGAPTQENLPPSTMRKRVCYVISQFPAPSETFAGNDLRSLRKLGVDVSVVNLRQDHPRFVALLREWDLEGLPVDSVTKRKLLEGVVRMFCVPGLVAFMVGTILKDNWRRPDHLAKSFLILPRAFQVHAALQARPPDVLHLFWGHYASLLGLLVRRTNPKVVVSTFLGAYDLRSEYRTSITLAREADQIFTHARANLPLLARQGLLPANVEVVYRGVDLERLQFQGQSKVPFRLVSAGRLIPAKGMADVIDVFARIQQQRPDASLCLIGEGPERHSLERRVERLGLESVEFTGHLPHQEVFSRLCEAEILMFLSYEEHLPNVVKEAMAARCACVVSRTTGIEELVVPEEHGVVVEPGDTEGAVAGALRLLREPDLRERMVARALAHLERHFDLRRSMTRYVDSWVTCLNRRRGLGTTDGAGGRSEQSLAARN